MPEKLPIPKLIAGLSATGIYDQLSQRKLELLASTTKEATEITAKEKTLTEKTFAAITRDIGNRGSLTFQVMATMDNARAGANVTFLVDDFLGFGNTGPVYAISLGNQRFAVKIYSARELQDSLDIHGKFGLAGILHDLEDQQGPQNLNELGEHVLSRKPKEVYGRNRRIVRIHNVGRRGQYFYLLMDLLGVDPINKIDPASLGGDIIDFISWAVDCAVGLCNLHVEERRLHLNIRPEAFIKKSTQPTQRLPRYTFFHYPKKFLRPKGSPCETTEFIMVDHLDNSVAVADKEPKGLATVGSWLFLPPEQIIHLLKMLKQDYKTYVEEGRPVEGIRTIKFKRTQMDDIWALGVIFYQFLAGGKYPFGEPRNLADMVNSILLTKFDFRPIDSRLRDLVSSMLEKDPQKRFQRLLQGCPENIQSRRVLAEAILYKLEQVVSEHASE